MINEMKRVLKPEGYIFLSVPSMNYYRNYKGKNGLYKNLNSDHDIESFYQYALNLEKVISDFENLGFKLVKFYGAGAWSGIVKDVDNKYILKFLYLVSNSKSFFMKVIQKIIFIILESTLSNIFGNTKIYIFSKN